MKKYHFITLLFVGLFIISCASNSGIERKTEGEFTVLYDSVDVVTYYTHKDLEIKGNSEFQNLRNSFLGENENLSLYIANKSILLDMSYYNPNWLFTDSIIFLDGDNNRMVIDYGKRTVNEVITSSRIHERYVAQLSEADISKFREMARHTKLYCVFSGSKRRTDKLEIKEAQKSAILKTFEKYDTLLNQKQ
mgnify:CR=1 FL=1